MFLISCIGIDLGTASVLIYVKGKGIILREPSVVAVSTDQGHQVVAVGEEAWNMIGRTPQSLEVIRPLKEGVISDYQYTEKMLKYFVQKTMGRRLFKPIVAVCVPSGVTEVEKRAVKDAAEQIGAREVHIIEEPLAAAVGAGLDIYRPSGCMVVDIGGGTTDIAVISMGGVVVNNSIKVAGDNFDEAIIRSLRKKYNILIGEKTAEEIKIKIGSASEKDEELSLQVRGRHLVSGLPVSVEVFSSDIREALSESVSNILEAVHHVLEQTPPELAADIYEKGIVLTGGGSMLRGLDQRLQEAVGVDVFLAEDAISCVAIGTGRFVEHLESHRYLGQ